MLKKIKKVIKIPLNTVVLFTKRVLLIRKLKELADGEYKTKLALKFYPQRASSTFSWQNFGWKNYTDYEFWKERICAIACLKMILDAFGYAENKDMAALTQEAISLGGYVVYDNKGKFVDKGWFHKPLLQLGRKSGLQSKGFSYTPEEQICFEILQNHVVITSVDAIPLKKKRLPKKGEQWHKIDHLVVVSGFRWENGNWDGFFIYNPSGQSQQARVGEWITREVFSQSFNNRCMSFWKE